GLEIARQVAPGVARRGSLLAADREDLGTDRAPAEPLVEKAPGVVAQHPDDHRVATLGDQPLEQREEEAAPDSLVLPVGRDVEGEDLAGELGAAPAPAAAAKTENVAIARDRDAHIARLALDHRRPAEFAAGRRKADEKRRRQDA